MFMSKISNLMIFTPKIIGAGLAVIFQTHPNIHSGSRAWPASRVEGAAALVKTPLAAHPK
jgi:hypothetical protein